MGDLLIRPLKRSRRPFCLELGFMLLAYWALLGPTLHKYQGAIFACIFRLVHVVSGHPLHRRAQLRMNGMVCPGPARV